MRAFALVAMICVGGCSNEPQPAMPKPVAPQPPQQTAPSQRTAPPVCGTRCAKAFAKQLSTLSQGGHRLVAIDVDHKPLRRSLVFTMAAAKQASAVRLDFDTNGKAVLGHSSKTVNLQGRARVYEDAAELMRMFARAWPVALADRDSIYALTLVNEKGRQVTVPIDPGDYHVVESVAEGAAAGPAVPKLLGALLGKYDLTSIVASPGKGGDRSAVTFAWSGGKDDRLVYVDRDAKGAPLRVELRWTKNIQPSHVLPPGQQAALRNWLRANNTVLRLRWVGERLVRASGHRLELHGAKGKPFVFDVKSLQ